MLYLTIIKQNKNRNSNLRKIEDISSKNNIYIYYDNKNRLTKLKNSNITSSNHYKEKTYEYDENDRLSNKKTTLLDGQVVEEDIIYKNEYNANKKRIRKIHNNGSQYVHNYILDENDNIIRERITFGAYKQENTYLYINNSIAGMIHNNQKYIFKKNIENDIIGIYDSNNNLVCRYVYDAWGNCTVYDKNYQVNTSAGFIGNQNPFRYKGYYYDVETQLYWVSSRYYSPELCRWISPDCVCYLNPTSINGLNLYSYCYNDPINYIDSSGCYPVRIQVGRLTIYFHPPHGNGPNAQHHIHIKNGNVKVASRNYDGSVHDKKYGKDYVPSDDVYNALLKHGWDWYGNKFSLFDFSGLYREEFPLQQSGYSLEQFPVTNIGSSVEVFPSLNNGFVLETIPQVTLDIPYYNPFPLTNQEKQILVVTAIVIVAVVAIALIPATGGGSAVLLLA